MLNSNYVQTLRRINICIAFFLVAVYSYMELRQFFPVRFCFILFTVLLIYTAETFANIINIIKQRRTHTMAYFIVSYLRINTC